MSAIQDLKVELSEHFDTVDDEDGNPTPNIFMQLYDRVGEVLEEHEYALTRAKELQAGAEKQAAEFLARALKAEAALKDAATYPSNDAKGTSTHACDHISRVDLNEGYCPECDCDALRAELAREREARERAEALLRDGHGALADVLQAERAAHEATKRRLETYRRRAFAIRRRSKHNKRMFDAIWNGELDCVECGRPTNNGMCTECRHGVSPFKKLHAERDAALARAEAAEYEAAKLGVQLNVGMTTQLRMAQYEAKAAKEDDRIQSERTLAARRWASAWKRAAKLWYGLGVKYREARKERDRLAAENAQLKDVLGKVGGKEHRVTKLLARCLEGFEAIRNCNLARGHAAADEMIGIIRAALSADVPARESAESLRKRLGFSELTEEQKQANFEHNLGSADVPAREDAPGGKEDRRDGAVVGKRCTCTPDTPDYAFTTGCPRHDWRAPAAPETKEGES